MKDTLKKLVITTVNRYLKHHKMNQCLKLKKQQKVEMISAHDLSNLQGIERNCDSPIDADEAEEVEAESNEEGSDEEADKNEDEVLRITCNEKKTWILRKMTWLKKVMFMTFMNMMKTLLMIMVMTNLWSQQLEVVYLQAKGGNCLFVKEFCFFKAMSVCF